jgi:glyoxylase-like metal-dependent hydrolase (beta-lactamase superfamily II)
VAFEPLSPLEYPWEDTPPPARTIEVAPGVRWLRMPLPFQLDHINLWLLDDGDGVAAVDTGVALPATRELWDALFAGELADRRLRRVIVTHFHPDHIGNAEWLTARFGVDLWCARTEWFAAQYARRSRGPADLEARLEHYRRHGIREEALAGLRERGNHYPGLVPALPHRFRSLRDGDVLWMGGHRWRVMTVEGHTPEHVCLWSAETQVLISGDEILPRITTNISVWAEEPYANPLRRYLDSLSRFQPLTDDALVLPSHGLPFRGLHARLDALRQHHEARLAETANALTEPRSAADLVPILFRRALDNHQLAFAIGEALAHLNFLEAESRAVRIVGADGVHRFRKA